MSETVLVLPVIVVVLVMILFYGWAWMRLQRASVQDRYEAWRQVYHAPGPKVLGPAGEVEATGDGDALRTGQINQTFWGGDALDLTYRGSNDAPGTSRERLIAAVRRRSNDAAELVEPLVDQRMPRGRTVGFETRLGSFSQVVDELNGPIHHRHTRLGNEWKYVNAVSRRNDGPWTESGYHVAPQPTLRDVYLPELDSRLEDLSGNAYDILVHLVRWYYLAQPKYRGPDVDYQFGIE